MRCGGRGSCTCNVCTDPRYQAREKPKAKLPKPKPRRQERGEAERTHVRKTTKTKPKAGPPRKRGPRPLTQEEGDEICLQVLQLMKSCVS